MINVSNEFKQALSNGNRNYINIVNITLADGTELTVENDKIMENGIQFEDAVGQDESFSALGGTVINGLTLVLNNIYDDFSDYNFTDAEITRIQTGLQLSQNIEYIDKGVFTVEDTVYNGATITLSCLDNMAKFDKPYSDSTLIYPASLDTIVRNLCTVCGVSLATSSLNFPRKNFVIDERPTDDAITCREVLSWCATIAGCFARCNVYGELELKWFETELFDDLVPDAGDLDGGVFDSDSPDRYTSGDIADGGLFNPWEIGDGYVVDGGGFDYGKLYIISSLYSQNLSVDDIVITQVQAEVKVKSDTRDSIETYIEGQPGYAIKISGNDFITPDNAQNIVTYLGDQLIGLTFRKANVSHPSDPTIEAGDCAVVIDRKGNYYQLLVTRTNFTVGSAQVTVCGADTPARNSATRFTEATKSYIELRKQIKEVDNPYAKAMSDLASAVSSASGMYKTEVPQPGGGVITYWHNLPNLNESDIQIMISDVGYTFTNNGTDSEPTWYGYTMDGNVLASILNVVGINADWINTGQLVIRKDDTEIFFADVDAGVVRISGNAINITSGDPIDTTINGVVSALRTEFNQTAEAIELEITQTSDDLDELKMHYRFDANGETIGKNDSNKTIRLANDGINMMVNNESVTRWNQDEMFTPRKIMVPIGGSLQLGNFVFQPRSNGNMSLFYVGDN